MDPFPENSANSPVQENCSLSFFPSQINRAFYGWGNSHYNCHYAADDCIVITDPKRLEDSTSSSSSSSSSSLSTSPTSCNGRQECVVEVEQSSNNKKCERFGFHDYMQVEYRCVPGKRTKLKSFHLILHRNENDEG